MRVVILTVTVRDTGGLRYFVLPEELGKRVADACYDGQPVLEALDAVYDRCHGQPNVYETGEVAHLLDYCRTREVVSTFMGTVQTYTAQ
jgi:hypothetical protein